MNHSTCNDDPQKIAEVLLRHLQAAKILRQQANLRAETAHDRLRLREWQAARLARSYTDLLSSPRYGQAAKFFLSDLYGPKDFSSRDEEIERILPMLTSMLPASALHTIALAIELDALTEALDSAMVFELCRIGKITDIDDQAYALAYRAVGRRDERQRQVVLIHDTGEALEKLASKPLLNTVLKLMRGPARLAGLGDLHEFLENGFDAFRKMGNASEFLERIRAKEQQLLNNFFSGAAQPFDI